MVPGSPMEASPAVEHEKRTFELERHVNHLRYLLAKAEALLEKHVAPTKGVRSDGNEVLRGEERGPVKNK